MYHATNKNKEVSNILLTHELGPIIVADWLFRFSHKSSLAVHRQSKPNIFCLFILTVSPLLLRVSLIFRPCGCYRLTLPLCGNTDFAHAQHTCIHSVHECRIHRLVFFFNLFINSRALEHFAFRLEIMKMIDSLLCCVVFLGFRFILFQSISSVLRRRRIYAVLHLKQMDKQKRK